MKKTLLSLVLMLFMAFSIVLTGCSDNGLDPNPDTNALVISNGGSTVVKGDYLYYINGYVDETTLSDKDNTFGEISFGAIYRTRLENGKISKNRDGFVNKTERVVPKVCGFSNGGFYIIDDYIYYTTPYMNYNKGGELQTSRVEFHRINIDGTDDQLIYTTNASESELDWTVYKVDGKVYIATYVESKIIVLNTEKKNSVVAEVEGSTSYTFYYEETYNAEKGRDAEAQKYIYFTRAIDTSKIIYSDYKGNEICKLNVATGEITSVKVDDTYTYSIVKVNKDNMYFTKQNAKTTGLTLMYRKPANIARWEVSHEVKMANIEFSSYFICDYGDNLMVAATSDALYIVESGIPTKVMDGSQTVLKVNNNNAYYISENKLYRFNLDGEVTNGTIEVEEVTDVENTYLITNGNYFDFDNQRVYVYRTYTSALDVTNTYLNYIDDSLKSRFVGKFEDEDRPIRPEQHEDYKEGSNNGVEYTPWID